MLLISIKIIKFLSVEEVCSVLLDSAGDPRRAQSSRRPQGGALSACTFPAQSFGNPGWEACGVSFSVCRARWRYTATVRRSLGRPRLEG